MLKVYPSPAVAAGQPFTFVVPGQYRWTIISIYGELTRAAGGTGTRQPTLTITDGTHTVSAAGFLDTGTDPGLLSVTWTNINTTVETTDATGFALVPFPQLTLPAGYTLTGTSVNDPGGDQWTTAAAWVDETYAG